MNRLHKKPLAGAIAAGLIALAHSAGAAEGGIQEVVVTAQKQEENLQTTPIAISALSAETLEKMGITDFSGVARASPSIHFTTYPASNMLTLYMRGQGINDPMQVTADGAVGIYQDGFYIGRPLASIFELAELERVEVLRGPQGTLYGRNTTGGAVNLVSRKPAGEFRLKQSFSVGTRDLFRSQTTIDLPAWNDIATRFTVLKSSQDGYVKNSGSSNDYGASAQLSGRFDLLWNIADTLSAAYFFETGNLESTPLYFQNEAVQRSNRVAGYTHADSHRTSTYRDIDLRETNSSFENHGLTLSWDASAGLTVKSLTGYREMDYDGFQDYAEALGTAASTNAINARDFIHDYTFSQEFQFVGKALNDRISYVSGLYYFRNSVRHDQDFFTGINATPGYVNTVIKQRFVSAEAESLAAYGQATWTPDILEQRLALTLGARFTRDKRSADRDITSVGRGPFVGGGPLTLASELNADNNQRFSRFNPAFTVNYAWNDDLSTYAKVSTGYRAGGSSEAAPIGSFNLTYGPENVTSYEAGLKSYAFDRRVRFNTAVFENRLEDMQLLIATDPADSSVVQGFNAGKARIRGIEAELLVQPLDDLSLSLNYTFMRTAFNKVTAPAGTIFDPVYNTLSPYAVGADIKRLFVVPNAPKHSVNLAADWTFARFDSSDLSMHFDYRWQDHMYTSALSGPDVPDQVNVTMPAHGILNGRFTWATELPRGDRARISIWGKNLTNQYYPAQTIGLGGGPIAVRNGGTGAVTPAGRNATAEAWSEPPSYGIDLVYEY